MNNINKSIIDKSIKIIKDESGALKRRLFGAEDISFPVYDGIDRNVVLKNKPLENRFTPPKNSSRIIFKDYTNVEPEDCIFNLLATFHRKKNVSFIEFFTEIDFSKYLFENKFYNFNSIKSIYAAYSGIKLEANCLTEIVNDVKYYEDVYHYRCNNEEVYAPMELEKIQDNILKYNSVK